MKEAAAVLVVLLAGIATACAGGGDGVEPVATSSCGELLYEGEGEPDVIVVSDLAPRHPGSEVARVMVDAIQFVLREREFRAGELGVGYQSCDYTVGDELDPSVCRRNAIAYVATEAVVGAIGPFHSGCAELQIPIVSRREAGPLAMISPSTTSGVLTRPPASRSLYPDGVRSFSRVVTHDYAQGTAAAHLARRSGARRAVVLHQAFSDDPAYFPGLTTSFVAAARALGLETVQMAWPLREDYEPLAAEVAAVQPDVVYLAGFAEQNAKTLMEDLRAALGPRVQMIAPDSFASSDIAEQLGPVGDGLLVTVPGIPTEMLPPAGKQFVRELGRTADEPGATGATEAGQATEVLLDAIARSDGTRASVVEELFATKVENGLLGSFTFDRFGDIDPAPVGVYRYEGGKIVVGGVIRTPLATGG